MPRPAETENTEPLHARPNMYLNGVAAERARMAIACTAAQSTRTRAILNIVAANRKDLAPSTARDTRAEWCARWRKRVPRTRRTHTQELVVKAVAQAKAKGDVEHEAFLRKFWNLNEHDEVVTATPSPGKTCTVPSAPRRPSIPLPLLKPPALRTVPPLGYCNPPPGRTEASV